MTGGTPKDAFRQFQDHLNGVLNRVVTQYRLTFVAGGSKSRDRAALFFGKPQAQVAVRLAATPWYLFLGQTLLAEPNPGAGFVLKTLAYAYRIQRGPEPSEEAVVRFEYVSDRQTDYCRNRVQFHRDYHDKIPGFSPHKFHIPTGWVTIESVIRFAITDLEVPALRLDWQDELQKSEEQFKTST